LSRPPVFKNRLRAGIPARPETALNIVALTPFIADSYGA
jgi:hypothetical protein